MKFSYLNLIKIPILGQAPSALEMEAYKELASIKGKFYLETENLRVKLENSISKPIYYYLQRHWGRLEKEHERLCPNCGNGWALENNQEKSFCDFDFRCSPCRLVSHIAVSFDDERKARIGEYKA